MNPRGPSRNEPDAKALRAGKSRKDNAPAGVDAETVRAVTSRKDNAPAGVDAEVRRAEKSRKDNAPVGVDAETVQQDLARYGALIANTEDVVNHNINAPLTVSRFGFVNALLHALFRRRD